MKLFCGGKFSDRVSSEKLLAVSAAGPPAAFFPEIDMSGFFWTCPFFATVRFCFDLVKISTSILKETPGKLSGGLQEALRRLSEAICASKALGQSWKAFCAETIVFFCKSGATDLRRRRVAKATCTKYRACAQKLSVFFDGGLGSGTRPVLSRPPEPL